MMPGNANTHVRQRAFGTLSTHPPKNPATAPMIEPISIAKNTNSTASGSETLAP